MSSADGKGNVPYTLTAATGSHFWGGFSRFPGIWQLLAFPPTFVVMRNMKEKVQHVCWKCSQVLFAHDLLQNGGKHDLISTGKTLTQDKLADCKAYHMTVPCVIANINSVGGAEASQGPGTTVWTFLEGQPSHSLLCVPQLPELLQLVGGNPRKGDKVVNQEHCTAECASVWWLTPPNPLTFNIHDGFYQEIPTACRWPRLHVWPTEP